MTETDAYSDRFRYAVTANFFCAETGDKAHDQAADYRQTDHPQTQLIFSQVAMRERQGLKEKQISKHPD